jgi:uncharacterized small protein (DUF1192 family)
MLTLERVHLVQFFLFEAETIRIEEVCGVFGPNGSGKSSFIDSVQIGMLGGSARLVALNAQADERHTTRSILGYCLGQYGEGPDQRVRDHATTYVTLVWRNPETHETVSMGVCMRASGDGNGHEVEGRYIAPGVDLSLGDHLEGEGDRKRPRDWKAFRTDLVRRAKASSDDDILFQTADRYVQAALLRLQGSGGIPDQKLFTRAFRFGLRMRFDKSVDQIVRDEVLESRPTEIKRFKETMDSMRAIQQMVAKVKQQIAAGEKVDEAYAIADRHARREVAWEAIGLDVEAERKMDQANDAQGQLQVAADAHQDNMEQMDACEKAHAKARTDFEAAVELRNAHAAHKDLEQYRTEAEKKRKDANKYAAALTQYLRDINAVAANASTSECLKDLKGAINAARETLSGVISAAHADLDDEQLESAVKASIKVLRQAWSALARESQSLHGQMEANEKDQNAVAENLQRAGQGQVELSRHVLALKQHLADHGVESTPVCDVVRVTDPRWQPVIEGYLGQPNLEALVVSDKEDEAFRLYRALSGKSAIYSAKLVLANRLKRQEPPKDSVATLIEGTHAVAVDYVRSTFGGILQAETDEEALGHARTLTPDGMLLGGAAVDRVKPATQLRLGVTPAQRIGHLKAELARLEREHQKLEASKTVVDSLLELIAEVPGEDKALSQIANLRKDYQEAIREEKSYQDKMHDLDDAGYAVLEGKVREAEGLLTECNDKMLASATAVGSSKTKLESAASAADRAQTSATLARKAADDFRSSREVDEDYVAVEWDKLLKEMTGEDRYSRMRARADSRRRNQADEKTSAVNKGNNALGDFLRDYREPIQDEVRNDWRRAWAWMEAILTRLKGTELYQYETEANEAVERAKEIFRADVAFSLSENLRRLDDTFSSLNAVLRTCPVFSNGERYRFHRKVRPDYAGLLTFVKNVATYGTEDTLWGSAGEVPQQFLDLLEEATALGAGSQRTPLDDYREFYEFDIEILRAPAPDEPFKVVGHLSKRIGPGSGGEHRSPLYVIAGAALASAYRINGKDRADGIRLILLDEAFNKMDPNNITATMRYFGDLGLQVFMASPGENLGTLTAFLHRYYDIVRDAENNAIHVTGHNVTEAARQLMRSDMVEFHPELLAEELARAPAASLATVEG